MLGAFAVEVAQSPSSLRRAKTMCKSSASVFPFVAILLAAVSAVCNAQLTSVVLPSNPNAASDWYTGSSIATSGTVIAAGAPGADTSESTSTSLPTGSGTGYVTLYSCPGGVATACTYASQVTGPSTGSLFGSTVVLLNSGTFLAVGAPAYSSSAGYVQFYTLATVTSPTSIQSYAPAYAASKLGFSLAGTMSGSTLWIFAGAPGYGSTSGAGDCSSSPCGTVAMYVCTVSSGVYTCPSTLTSYAFSASYYNQGYAISAVAMSSTVVGLASIDSHNTDLYLWSCSTTSCSSATNPGTVGTGIYFRCPIVSYMFFIQLP